MRRIKTVAPWGRNGRRNAVAVILKTENVKSVHKVKRVSDRVMNMNIEIGGLKMNTAGAHGPQAVWELEEREKF